MTSSTSTSPSCSRSRNVFCSFVMLLLTVLDHGQNICTRGTTVRRGRTCLALHRIAITGPRLLLPHAAAAPV